MKISTRRLLTGGLAIASLFSMPAAANAYGSYSDGDSTRQRGEASSYINPDTGAATANPDVAANSNCFTPDQSDNQAFTKNVHNDACFLDRDGNKLDGPATFESSGVGFISACPDPDGTGPKVAVLTDTNKDGRNDRCFQSGYQQKNAAGDLEFHARMNNNGTAGTQYVTWCSDSDRDGCSDEWNKSSIRINWSADGTASSSSDDGSRLFSW